MAKETKKTTSTMANKKSFTSIAKIKDEYFPNNQMILIRKQKENKEAFGTFLAESILKQIRSQIGK